MSYLNRHKCGKVGFLPNGRMYVSTRVRAPRHLTHSIAASFNQGSLTLPVFFAKNVHDSVPQFYPY